MGGYLLMSEGERLRKVILEGVREGRLTLAAAALRLEVTYRHLRRVWKRYRDEGDPGLVHRGRGRPSNRAKPPSLRRKALERYRERYKGFGPTLATEKLAEEGLVLDHETLRRWLIRRDSGPDPRPASATGRTANGKPASGRCFSSTAAPIIGSDPTTPRPA